MCHAAPMTSVAERVGAALDRHASPATVRLGRELADGGEVDIERDEPALVEARVGGGASGSERRRVTLTAADAGLTWTCTCTRDRTMFCKHVVAVAVVVRA